MANILIADDEQGIRTLLSHQFRADGHSVHTAADGLEALKACRALQFDVIFCDLFMPGMEGLETIRNLRKKFPRLRVVAMSGAANSYGGDLLHVARMMGVTAVLEKPFRWQEVTRVLGDMLLAAAKDELTADSSCTPRPAVS